MVISTWIAGATLLLSTDTAGATEVEDAALVMSARVSANEKNLVVMWRIFILEYTVDTVSVTERKGNTRLE